MLTDDIYKIFRIYFYKQHMWVLAINVLIINLGAGAGFLMQSAT